MYNFTRCFLCNLTTCAGCLACSWFSLRARLNICRRFRFMAPCAAVAAFYGLKRPAIPLTESRVCVRFWGLVRGAFGRVRFSACASCPARPWTPAQAPRLPPVVIWTGAGCSCRFSWTLPPVLPWCLSWPPAGHVVKLSPLLVCIASFFLCALLAPPGPVPIRPAPLCLSLLSLSPLRPAPSFPSQSARGPPPVLPHFRAFKSFSALSRAFER